MSAKPKVKAKAKNSAPRTSAPVRWRKEVERVLITDGQIARRIKTLAREIERDFRGREMVVVFLLNGRWGSLWRGALKTPVTVLI